MLIGLGLWLLFTTLLDFKWSLKLLIAFIIGSLITILIDLTILNIIVGTHTIWVYAMLPAIIYWCAKSFKFELQTSHYFVIVFLFTFVQILSMSSYMFDHWLLFLIIGYFVSLIIAKLINIAWFFKSYSELTFRLRLMKITLLCLTLSSYTWIILKEFN